MREPSSRSFDELNRSGGPRTALRVVAPGEDPRVLSADPDLFFRKPRPVVSALWLAALVALSVLTVGLVTIGAWPGDETVPMPWFAAVLWVLAPWVALGPLWAWWGRHRWLGARVRRGRASVADLLAGTPPERGTAFYVSRGESPTGWRHIDASVVVGTPAEDELAFRHARTGQRWPADTMIGLNDPVWIWRGADGWVFGQIAVHGQDPTYTPEEPRPPSWESQHGGHTPAYFVAEMTRLAMRYRAGELTRAEHDAALKELLDND